MIKNGWILPTDKLPEDGENVLITIAAETVYAGSSFDSDTVFIAMYHEAEDGVWHSQNHFCLWDREGTCLTTDVLAWMPLPEPYKEELDE